MTNLLEYLEATAKRVPDKIAFADERTQLTFSALEARAKAIGSALLARGLTGQPVVVFMEKSPEAISAFLGAIYAGCFYVPLDEEMPKSRIERILSQLSPKAVLLERAALDRAAEYGFPAMCYEEAAASAADEAALARVRSRALDVDPTYVVFTSGSTGVPKGVIACHRSVIDYAEALSEVLRADQSMVFGMQVPLYVDACLKEILCTLKYGATTWLIPRQLFLSPVRLVEYLNEHKINTLCWVVSALTLISGLGTFKKAAPQTLTTIAFGSEVFPIKQFNLWRQYVPGARYLNLYGPTEATGMSCWYEVDREFALDESIPIGRPFKNTQILLIGEDGKPAAPGEQGEICIRGTSLALGYYNAPEKTAQAFCQNPLNSCYPERIYRTGDIGAYNERGELVFVSRKDSQIKHMGHRIELGEIELAANGVEGVEAACCLFDKEKKKIVLFFAGAADEAALSAALREKVPRYMLPNRIYKQARLPLTANGKLDRAALRQAYAQTNF